MTFYFHCSLSFKFCLWYFPHTLPRISNSQKEINLKDVKSVCSSAMKFMKLFLKLQLRKRPQIALVWKNVLEIKKKKLLQNIYNAIINWNPANFYCWENRKGNNFKKCYSSFLVAAIILFFLLLLLLLLHPLPSSKAEIPSVLQALTHSRAAPQGARSWLWFPGPVPHGSLNANHNQNFLRWLDIFESLAVVWLRSCIRHHDCYISSVPYALSFP